MQAAALRIKQLLENLEKEDYDKAVSYIEFLVSTRKKEKIRGEKTAEDKGDVEAIVASLVGAIPDTGRKLEEYRNERLKKIYYKGKSTWN